MSTESGPRRGPGRPPMRVDAREDTREPSRLYRKHRYTDDKFEVPENLKVDGYDYNWKAMEYAGKSVDPIDFVRLKENHWAEVMADEMPDLSVPGQKGAITKMGLVLMKRPKYLSDEARAEEVQAAGLRLRGEAQTFSRGGEGVVSGMPVKEFTISESFRPGSIPD